MESEEILKQSLKQKEEHYGGSHLEVASELSKLGGFYLELDEGVKAQDAYERALTIIEWNHGPEHREVGRALYNLGNSYLSTSPYRASDNERAKRLLKKALGLKTWYHDPDDVEAADILHKLGNSCYISNDNMTAKTYLKRALKIKQGVHGPEHLEVAKLMNNLGANAHALEDYESARKWYERALPILERYFNSGYVLKGTRIPFYYSMLQNLRNTYDKLDGTVKSTQCNLRALNTLKHNCELDNPHSKGRSVHAMTKHVTLLRGKRGNEPCWCYIISDKENQRMLTGKAKLGSINVEDYGKILYLGRSDEPPENIEPEMDHLFSFIRARDKLTEINKLESLNRHLTKYVKCRVNDDVYRIDKAKSVHSAWEYFLVDPNKKTSFICKPYNTSTDYNDYGKILLSGADKYTPETISHKFENARKLLSNNLFITRGKSGVLHYVIVDNSKKDQFETLEMDTCTKEIVEECGIIIYSSWGDDPPEIICHQLCLKYISFVAEKVKSCDPEPPYISDLMYAVRNAKYELMEYFFDKVSGVNVGDENGWTVLHHAAYGGKMEVIRHLVIQCGTNIHIKDVFGRKPIHISSREGHIHAVEFFLDRGANVAETDDNNWTPLHYAVWKGDLQMVQYLVQCKADISAIDEIYGKQPIHIAVKMNHKDIIQYLISNGADVNARDSIGFTPIHYAAKSGKIQMVECLYQHNADISPKSTRTGHCMLPIHVAGAKGYKNIVEFFINKGTDVNVEDRWRNTPLHYAAKSGNMETVEYLYHQKADIWYKPRFTGQLPIHLAAEAGHQNVVEFLISKGNGVDVKNDSRRTPLHCATSTGKIELVEYLYNRNADLCSKESVWGMQPIHTAAREGHKNVIEFLISKGIDINVRDSGGCTPLHHAANRGHMEVIEYLHDQKADLCFKEKSLKMLPMHMAANYGHFDTVEFLINNGNDVNEKDCRGQTCLHYAASRGYERIVKCLLGKNIDRKLKDARGKTALDYAKEKGYDTIVEMLNNI